MTFWVQVLLKGKWRYGLENVGTEPGAIEIDQVIQNVGASETEISVSNPFKRKC